MTSAHISSRKTYVHVLIIEKREGPKKYG